MRAGRAVTWSRSKTDYGRLTNSSGEEKGYCCKHCPQMPASIAGEGAAAVVVAAAYVAVVDERIGCIEIQDHFVQAYPVGSAAVW